MTGYDEFKNHKDYTLEYESISNEICSHGNKVTKTTRKYYHNNSLNNDKTVYLTSGCRQCEGEKRKRRPIRSLWE
ncbi:hypothetical protein [Bacillus inaquosorum]|uniref:hypothetical protein n=1 Tax=Bacillus inaquosorum TaxID=483913 RepID=UPI001C614152|nr:hypothetical protein [Bacillus inaquosorum]